MSIDSSTEASPSLTAAAGTSAVYSFPAPAVMMAQVNYHRLESAGLDRWHGLRRRAGCDGGLLGGRELRPARGNRLRASGRAVRATGGNTTYSLFYEVEIYGAVYPVLLLDENRIELCNHTGLRRDFVLLVGR